MPFNHLQNKANLPDTRMNLSSVKTKYYENERLPRRRENKPNQTRSEAEIPTGELLEILKPGTKQTHPLSKLFFFFPFLCPGYNLPMQNWTIQKLLNWITEHFTDKGIDSPRLSAELHRTIYPIRQGGRQGAAWPTARFGKAGGGK
jgi:hypothetical protein